jgi:membrane-bound metal-dependent hydrolase YbcI (DUF457 family)
MMGPTHKLVCGSAAFVATTALGLPAVVVAASVVGSASTYDLPDIDQKIGLPHRKITHWPSVQIAFFAACGLLLAHYYPPKFDWPIAILAASMAFGCVMHSIADSMTIARGGIQLLWPFRLRGYHLAPRRWRVEVGSKSRSERRFIAIWCGFVLIYAYARFRHLIFA